MKANLANGGCDQDLFFVCLFVWLSRVFFTTCGIFSCRVWDLVVWPGIEPRPPALGAWSLCHLDHQGSPQDLFFFWNSRIEWKILKPVAYILNTALWNFSFPVTCQLTYASVMLKNVFILKSFKNVFITVDYGHEVKNNWLHRKEWFMYLWVARGKYLKGTGPSTEYVLKNVYWSCACYRTLREGQIKQSGLNDPNPWDQMWGLLRQYFLFLTSGTLPLCSKTIAAILMQVLMFQDHCCHSNASPHVPRPLLPF